MEHEPSQTGNWMPSLRRLRLGTGPNIRAKALMKTQVELKIAARMENLDLFLQGRGDTADTLRMEARLNQFQISGWLGTPMTAGRSEVGQVSDPVAGSNAGAGAYRPQWMSIRGSWTGMDRMSPREGASALPK